MSSWRREVDIVSRLATRAGTAEPGIIDRLFAVVRARPDVISFAAGAPDTSLLPVELLSELNAGAVARFGADLLQYGPTQGALPLRTTLVPMLRARGVRCSPADVHIATGGSGALNNVCLALLDPGDTVVVERPTYAPAIKAFRIYQANVVDVKCDEHGMLPDALAEMLDSRPVKAVYLLPTFQNPTGRTMPADRRAAIAAVARQWDVLLIEDDVYGELRYRRAPVEALAAYAPERTIYLGSLSKVLAPAMRIGVAVMPAPLLDRVLAMKQVIDMQTSSYTQALANEFLIGGHAERHLNRLLGVYSRRLGLLDQALTEHLPPDFSWRVPDGGMFLWLAGPAGLDTAALLPAALADGVAFVPGNAFHIRDGDGHDALRLGFASVPDDRIEDGVRRLAKSLTS